MRKPLLAAQALALAFAGIVSASGQEAGTVAAGRRLALKVCANYHVVSQSGSPADPQPAGPWLRRDRCTARSHRGVVAQISV